MVRIKSKPEEQIVEVQPSINSAVPNKFIVKQKSSGFIARSFKFFFGFHVITILGFFIGCIIFNIQSETNPLTGIVSSGKLYFIGFSMVFVLHFLYWIFADKATFFNIKNRLFLLFWDYIFLILSTLSTVGTLFLLNTYVL